MFQNVDVDVDVDVDVGVDVDVDVDVDVNVDVRYLLPDGRSRPWPGKTAAPTPAAGRG